MSRAPAWTRARRWTWFHVHARRRSTAGGRAGQLGAELVPCLPGFPAVDAETESHRRAGRKPVGWSDENAEPGLASRRELSEERPSVRAGRLRIDPRSRLDGRDHGGSAQRASVGIWGADVELPSKGIRPDSREPINAEAMEHEVAVLPFRLTNPPRSARAGKRSVDLIIVAGNADDSHSRCERAAEDDAVRGARLRILGRARRGGRGGQGEGDFDRLTQSDARGAMEEPAECADLCSHLPSVGSRELARDPRERDEEGLDSSVRGTRS